MEDSTERGPEPNPTQQLHFRVRHIHDDGVDLILVDESGQEWLKTVPTTDLASGASDLCIDQAGIMNVYEGASPDDRWCEYGLIPAAESSEPDDDLVRSVLQAIDTDSD